MTTVLYGEFVRNIAKTFDEALSRIEVVHNFDYGDEFEIAICETLRQVLPHRFGVCRGYAINSSGEEAGDDILLYERVRFPTSRLLGEDLSRKEKVPIEAVFAYIEAKHTLQLDGDGDSSLRRAFRQVSSVKALCNQREAVSPNQIAPGVYLGDMFNTLLPSGWPQKRNPIYAAIFSRRVRVDPCGPVIEDPDQIDKSLIGQSTAVEQPPDLVVAGRSNLALPVVRHNDGQRYLMSPFLITTDGELTCRVVDGIAFGVALAHLLWAIDNIVLGSMPWGQILGSNLGL